MVRIGRLEYLVVSYGWHADFPRMVLIEAHDVRPTELEFGAFSDGECMKVENQSPK
jgi:hypothetical protein